MPSCRRLVPRTAQPCSSSDPPSTRPRQPQPTINARAILALGRFEAAAVAQALELLGGHFLAQLLLVAIGESAATAHLVLRVEHLLHVVDLVLDLEFRRAGRL